MKDTSAPNPHLKELADKQREATAQNIKTQIRLASIEMETLLSRMNTVMIGDQPIGGWTVAKVRGWVTQQAASMSDADLDSVRKRLRTLLKGFDGEAERRIGAGRSGS